MATFTLGNGDSGQIGQDNQVIIRKVPLVILHGVMDSQLWGVWEPSDIVAQGGKDPGFIREILTLGQIGDSDNLSRAYDFMVLRTVGQIQAAVTEGAIAIRNHVKNHHSYRVAMPAQTLGGNWAFWGRAGDGRNGEPPDPDDPQIAAEAFAIPYDWRRSNNRNAQHLAAALRPGGLLRNHLSAAVRDLKFVIIAHSMGGLVARLAIEQHGAHQDVAALITLGTPHHGSAKMVSGLLGFQQASLNLTKMHPRVFRSVIPRLPGPMELTPASMLDVYGHMAQAAPSAVTQPNQEFRDPIGFYSPHNRSDRHVQKLTKEFHIQYFPEVQELSTAVGHAVSNARAVINLLNNGGPPGGVRYYCLGVANRYTPYAIDWRPRLRALERASLDYLRAFDSDWADRKWNNVRGTLSNIVSTEGAITAGNSYPGINYRVYLDVGNASAHPQDLVGGDDTVPIRSALARNISGVHARAVIDMDGPATTGDGELVDDGHSKMCAEPALRRILTAWLTRENVRQGCWIPNWDEAAADDERRR